MRSMKGFIVHVPKRTNDSVQLADGVEIYMETKFDEFRHRVIGGEVVALPVKYETPVEVGDTVYFHHHVVLNGGAPVPGMEDCYTVMYHPSDAMDSQAFAYKSQKTGELGALSSWCLLEHVEEDNSLKSDFLEVVDFSTKNPTKGRLVFACDMCEVYGVKPGDIVGIEKNRDYRVTIDDKEYYRTRVDDFSYVEV